MAIREVIISASDEEADWIKHVKKNPPDVEMADYGSLLPAIQILRGGKGSGNWGHKGRKGKRGGSSRAGASLPKGTAPDGSISVSDGAKNWLLSDVAPNRSQFTDEFFTLQTFPAEKSAYKQRIAQKLAKDTGIPEALQSEYVRQWAETSNDARYASLLVQSEASEKFGVELSEWQEHRFTLAKANREHELKPRGKFIDPGKLHEHLASPYENPDGSLKPGMNKYKDHKAATRATLDAMYNHTQAELKDAGIESVTLYRGVSAHHGRSTRSHRVPLEGEVVNVSGNVLESWTLNPKTAGVFGTAGTVLKMEVPASRIFSTAKTGFGCLDETEFVVIGGKNMGQARVMNESVVNNAFR